MDCICVSAILTQFILSLFRQQQQEQGCFSTTDFYSIDNALMNSMSNSIMASTHQLTKKADCLPLCLEK